MTFHNSYDDPESPMYTPHKCTDECRVECEECGKFYCSDAVPAEGARLDDLTPLCIEHYAKATGQ